METIKVNCIYDNGHIVIKTDSIHSWLQFGLGLHRSDQHAHTFEIPRINVRSSVITLEGEIEYTFSKGFSPRTYFKILTAGILHAFDHSKEKTFACKVKLLI